MSRGIELSICVLGVYVCFLTWGLTQERVSTRSYDGEKFKSFVVLNAAQALFAALVGFVYLKLRSQRLSIHMSTDFMMACLKLSLISSIASPIGYAALKHISYPTFILGKTCKLVPVVVMNFVLYRKVFPLSTYLVVGLITLGVSSFMLLNTNGSNKGATSNSLYGLCLIALNLILDGVTNSTQDRLFRRYKVPGISMMVFMNVFSAGLMILYLILNPASTELSTSFGFFERHPEILLDITIFGLTGALGQCFIFHTLERFGSLLLVTITVTRKMFSIILSVLWFGHSISLPQWGSVGLVFLGIVWETRTKSKSHTAEEITPKEMNGTTINGKVKKSDLASLKSEDKKQATSRRRSARINRE